MFQVIESVFHGCVSCQFLLVEIKEPITEICHLREGHTRQTEALHAQKSLLVGQKALLPLTVLEMTMWEEDQCVIWCC